LSIFESETPTMSRLSVVIITYNEEKKIGRCLESVLEIADEIIVVDSFSTDSTKAICALYPVRFIGRQFHGYIEQKQFAFEQISHEYALSLDADEYLSKELIESIKKVKQNFFPKDGYIVDRFNNYCGQWIKHGDYYPDRKLRLWKKGTGNWGGENPHDKVLMNAGTTTSRLEGKLLHFSFATLEEHFAKMNKFSSVAAENLYKKGKGKNYFKLIFSPIWSFVNGYIFKLGFLDGAAGFTIARVNVWYTYMKYVKLIRLHQKQNND
jgi:glycosyltransferase involved in cell wall biosynthesis